MSHFNTLLDKITSMNEEYATKISNYKKAKEEVDSLEKELGVANALVIAKENQERHRHNQWQFIHDYATWLQDYVLHNLKELTAEDVELFDLVPYTVYEKLTEKTIIIISAIHKNELKY